MSEFDLIKQYFTRPTPSAALGVGDDAALLNICADMELAVSTDMLVCGTHFFPDADPFFLGHKTLAVNLSDLAAMAATPRWATLALSLPSVDENWLQQFSQGFFTLADKYGVELIGGDTTRGPLNLSVTIMGEVPRGTALRRDAAQVDDDIWVSGMLGEAALALAHLQGRIELPADIFSACATRLHQPQPRVELGLALRGIANSAIDVSDGLMADLGHILERSQVGAEIFVDRVCACDAGALAHYSHGLPLAGVTRQAELKPDLQEMMQRCILAGGDDYELCFTVPVAHRNAIEKISNTLALPLTRIGKIKAGAGCVVLAEDGSQIKIEGTGYDHFE
ncbi:MAG: thiamine-phosphate kinase [Gallionellaceae bacterium]|nr:thiamine-phosphate kinase [Gallionellaceae bacterium]